MIHDQWDELLRLAGSLHDATVTASLLVARLHAQQRRSRFAVALQDYGRLVMTEFILRYLTHPPDRRGIHRQLNKHESINALEDTVFYGNEGRIRLQTLDRQSTQAAAIALVSAAIVTWNTHHMTDRRARMRSRTTARRRRPRAPFAGDPRAHQPQRALPHPPRPAIRRREGIAVAARERAAATPRASKRESLKRRAPAGSSEARPEPGPAPSQP